MKAIILAAGYATRLYPLTENHPKPLLSVGEKPMVEHILDSLKDVAELDEVFVVTNDKFYDHFLRWLKEYEFPKKINIVNDGTLSNDDRLGAVGDMHFVISREKIADDVMVIGGDNLFEFSVRDFASFFKKNKGSVIAAYDLLDKSKLAKKFGVVELDHSFKVVGFEEKPEFPKTSLASTCCYIFSKDDVVELKKCIAENKKPDNTGDFIRYLASKKPVYAFTFTERWWDVGSHEQLEEANEYWSKK